MTCIGGGRIKHGDESILIYGFSQAYGRCVRGDVMPAPGVVRPFARRVWSPALTTHPTRQLPLPSPYTSADHAKAAEMLRRAYPSYKLADIEWRNDGY